MLAGLVGTVVAAGLLMRGAEGLWARSALILVLLAGVTAWLCGRIASGWLPLPESRIVRWAAALAAAAAVFALVSPVAGAGCVWVVFAAGLAIIPIASMIDSEGRGRLERLLRACAWMLVLAAFYQRLHGQARPPASLPNANAFAGALLLLLPMAVRAGDGALAAGLLLCLWWTSSVGAWLGLSAALIAHRRAVGAAAFWFGAAAGFVGLIVVYAKLQSPGVLHRMEWWGVMRRAAADAPWMAAYAGLCLAGLAALLVAAPAGRRFGPVAVLMQGLADHALAVPGVFWLFCVCVALAAPHSGRGLNIPLRRRLVFVVLVLAAGLAAGWSVWAGAHE